MPANDDLARSAKLIMDEVRSAQAMMDKEADRIDEIRREALRFALPPYGQQSYIANALGYGTPTQEANEAELSKAKVALAEARKQAEQLANSLKNESSEKVSLTEKLAEAERQIDESRKKVAETEQFGHLLNRVAAIAHQKLKDDHSFADHFENGEPQDAFVMSIDIRRSTELMLKAREPKLFAEFVTTLWATLRKVILSRFGVFDKFTGDGILAFFPNFYSGKDAGLRAIDAADMCHRMFEKQYGESRRSFTAVLKDTGLGIGIDYGKIQMVRVAGELTVVGNPVVYACRMAGAPAGATFLNQPAYEVIFDRFADSCHFSETAIAFKHEGEMVAYAVRRNERPINPKPPEWLAQSSATPEAASDSVSEPSRAAE